MLNVSKSNRDGIYIKHRTIDYVFNRRKIQKEQLTERLQNINVRCNFFSFYVKHLVSKEKSASVLCIGSCFRDKPVPNNTALIYIHEFVPGRSNESNRIIQSTR